MAEPALEGVVAALTLLPLESGGELLERAAGVSGAVYAAATRELERRGVLARGEFAHPLYREAAARLVPPPARREAARRALASSVSGLSVRGDAQGMARVIERLPPAARSGPEWLRRQVRLLRPGGARS